LKSALGQIEKHSARADVSALPRLVFVVSDPSNPSQRAVVAKLVFPAEVMADLAQMIAADRPESGAAFARLPTDAVKH
jgi:hypothetical protein